MVAAAQYGEVRQPEMPNTDTAAFKNFAGLNNRLPPERLATTDLAAAVNVDLDDSGGIRSRAGFTPILTGDCHSLWANGNTCLFVQNGQLMQLQQDLTAVPLGVFGLNSLYPLSYTAINGVVYWSNGTLTGVVQNGVARSWGLPTPPIPKTNIISGSLPPATYGVTATYLRNDGQEGGATNIQQIVVPTGQPGYGFQFSITPPTDPTISAVRVYITPPNGTEFFLAAQIDLPTISGTYTGDGNDLTVPIWTQFKEAPPAGTQVINYNGRIYIAQGQFLWYTEPFSYELMDFGENFLWFSSPITIVAPVTGGMFVATETETVWLEGMDAKELVRQPKLAYGAIPGTLSYADGTLVGGGQFTGQVALWASTQGICAAGNEGFIKGVLKNLTQDRVSYPGAPRGAGIFRQADGINQFLTMLNSPNDEPNNAFMGDDVTATVIRNGQIVST